MKITNNLLLILLSSLFLVFGCSDDDDMIIPEMMVDAPNVNLSMNQTVEIANIVTIDGSGSTGDGALAYDWSVIDPAGSAVVLDNSTSSMISFEVNIEGDYAISLSVTNDGGTNMKMGTVTVTNRPFSTLDQMGRPAINTVFNFFGDAATKNGYNVTTPSSGNVDAELFKGILDALQTYIGLDAAEYRNVLGIDNTTMASILATDVLMSNKSFSSTYGPSDLADLRLGENLLNGRGLNDDVIDVTLILTFAGDLTNMTPLQLGLISDNVQSNDQSHSDQFPYLAAPH